MIHAIFVMRFAQTRGPVVVGVVSRTVLNQDDERLRLSHHLPCPQSKWPLAMRHIASTHAKVDLVSSPIV